MSPVCRPQSEGMPHQYAEASGVFHEPNSWHHPSTYSFVMKRHRPHHRAPLDFLTGEAFREITKLIPVLSGVVHPAVLPLPRCTPN